MTMHDYSVPSSRLRYVGRMEEPSVVSRRTLGETARPKLVSTGTVNSMLNNKRPPWLNSHHVNPVMNWTPGVVWREWSLIGVKAPSKFHDVASVSTFTAGGY